MLINARLAMERTSYIRWNCNGVRFILDQHTELYFYSAGSLKQHSTLHFDTITRFRAIQYLLFLLSFAYIVGKQHIPISLSLIWRDRGSICDQLNSLHHRCGILLSYIDKFSLLLEILIKIYIFKMHISN